MTWKHANRRDRNEREIVEFWRRAGALWTPMRLGVGFDGLLAYHGQVYIVEIKNNEANWEMTDAELDTAMALDAIGVKYHIVESLAGAAKLIGLEIE